MNIVENVFVGVIEIHVYYEDICIMCLRFCIWKLMLWTLLTGKYCDYRPYLLGDFCFEYSVVNSYSLISFDIWSYEINIWGRCFIVTYRRRWNNYLDETMRCLLCWELLTNCDKCRIILWMVRTEEVREHLE